MNLFFATIFSRIFIYVWFLFLNILSYYLVTVVKLNDGAAPELAVCAPYGGALAPNVIPVVVAAGTGTAAATGAETPSVPSVGVVPSAGVPSVGFTVAVGVPKPNVGAGCEAATAADCVFEAPNAKPVFAVVVCGVPNENPDIFTFS